MLRCQPHTPFFSAEHGERLTLTSFRAMRAAPHAVPCVEGVEVLPPQRRFRPWGVAATTARATGSATSASASASVSTPASASAPTACPYPHSPAPEVSPQPPSAAQAQALVDYASFGLPLQGGADGFSAAVFGEYVGAVSAPALPLPTAATATAAATAAAAAAAATSAGSGAGAGRGGRRGTACELKKQLRSWRRASLDPLALAAPTTSPLSPTPTPEPAGPRPSMHLVGCRERMTHMPGAPLDEANQAWLARPDADADAEAGVEGGAGAGAGAGAGSGRGTGKTGAQSVSSFPAFGLRKGRRSSRPSQDDEAAPAEPGAAAGLLSLPGLVAGAAIDSLPSAETFSSVNPFSFLFSGIFAAKDKAITQA